MKRTVTLLIVDGWGIGPKDYGNPIHASSPPTIQYIRSNYAIGSLQSSGIAVGLPWEEEGNSEVGHLTIGAGKIIYQHYPRISLKIRNGLFFNNEVLKKAFTNAKEKKSAVHLVGLLTAGNVHASLEHVAALLELAKRENTEEVYLHLFSDGKDSPPRSVLPLIERVEDLIKKSGKGKIASIAGRYYAEDRDDHWNRTERSCEVLLGKGLVKENIKTAIEEYYAKGLNDDAIEPFCLLNPTHGIKDNDSVIFFDFREDSIRQIVTPFATENFNKFPFEKPKDLFLVTFTNYSDNLKAEIAFPADKITTPLGKVLAENGKTQIRLAETEKYAHVTYFFDGYREEPFDHEYQVLVPSRKVSHHDEHPEMMTREISSRIIESIESSGFDAVIANFANSDMIAHTGNYDAALVAIKVIDEEIKKIMDVTLNRGHILIITADHGHLERMIDPHTGKTITRHNADPVPIYVIGRGFEKPKSLAEADRIEKNPCGLLSDVAPTVLSLLEIPIPSEMTGQNIIPLLQ